LKVLQVTPYYYPHIGGVESHVKGLSKGLSQRNIEVVILTSRDRKNLPEYEVIDNIPVYRAFTPLNLFNTPIPVGLGKYIKKIKPDVMHLHMPPPVTSFMAIMASKKYSIPACMTYHADLDLSHIVGGKYIVKFYQITLANYTVKNAKKIIVHTKSYQQTSSLIWHVQPDIIPSAVDYIKFNPDIDRNIIKEKLRINDKKVILFVGRLVPHKNVDFLIKALSRLPKEYFLLVVGNGPLLNKLKNLATFYNVNNRINFATNVSDEELPYYYAASDVFVLPSLSRLEAFGMATLEAMASGKVVIVSDIPGVRELVVNGQNGFLFNPMIETDINEKIEYVFKNEALMKKIRQNARDTVISKFNWNKVVDKIIEVYNSILNL